jgi:hypothetical protein
VAQDAANHSEEPDDNPENRAEESGPADAGTGDGRRSRQPSPQRPLLRFDPSLIRAVDEYRRAMFRLERQVEPAFEALARAARTAEPALRSYNAFVEKAGADIARVIAPAVESMSRASVVLGRIDWASLLETMRAALPPNWDETVDLAIVESILNDEGIPLVFVPNNTVLRQLLAAPDRAARIAILLTTKEQVLADCQSTLAEVTHSSLAGQLPLAKDAVASCQDGHAASGQALAVSVVETIVSNILGLNYGQAQRNLVLNLDDLPYTEIRVKAALAPIPKFYTSWWPNSGVPAPVGLSRHVSVHQADVQHFTEENALIASMLVASVVKAVDESQHEPQPEPVT